MFQKSQPPWHHTDHVIYTRIDIWAHALAIRHIYACDTINNLTSTVYKNLLCLTKNLRCPRIFHIAHGERLFSCAHMYRRHAGRRDVATLYRYVSATHGTRCDDVCRVLASIVYGAQPPRTKKKQFGKSHPRLYAQTKRTPIRLKPYALNPYALRPDTYALNPEPRALLHHRP